jgi:lipopolysaccharide export system ATP-binding protein
MRITEKAYLLADGRVFCRSTPEELASSSEVRRVYLGEDFVLDRSVALARTG